MFTFAVLWCFQIPVVAIKSVRNIFEKMAADSADGGAPSAPPASHQKKVTKSVGVTGYQSGGGHIAEPVIRVNAAGVERTQAASVRDADYGWVLNAITLFALISCDSFVMAMTFSCEDFENCFY